jgi:hypothetical protein
MSGKNVLQKARKCLPFIAVGSIVYDRTFTLSAQSYSV